MPVLAKNDNPGPQVIHEPGTGLDIDNSTTTVTTKIQLNNNQQGGQGVHEAGTGLGEPELKAENKGTGLVLVSTTGTMTDSRVRMNEERRSQVATVVQTMLQAADKLGDGMVVRLEKLLKLKIVSRNKLI